MEPLFYISGAVAVIATFLMVTRVNAVHALLYFAVALIAVALVFFALGAPFVAALEVIIYAGAIVVLLVFVVMMLNLGEQSVRAERSLLPRKMWIGPAILSAILVAEVIYAAGTERGFGGIYVGPVEVGVLLFGPYIIGVQLAGLILLAALVGAFHLGFPGRERREVERDADTVGARFGPSGDTVRTGTGGTAGAP
jgi:NADH-quinone oxidoreductase subunit J